MKLNIIFSSTLRYLSLIKPRNIIVAWCVSVYFFQRDLSGGTKEGLHIAKQLFAKFLATALQTSVSKQHLLNYETNLLGAHGRYWLTGLAALIISSDT